MFWSLITHEIDSGAPLEMLKTWHSKKTHLRTWHAHGMLLTLTLSLSLTLTLRKPEVRMPCARCNKCNMCMCMCMYGHAACVWRAHHAKSSKSLPS